MSLRIVIRNRAAQVLRKSRIFRLGLAPFRGARQPDAGATSARSAVGKAVSELHRADGTRGSSTAAGPAPASLQRRRRNSWAVTVVGSVNCRTRTPHLACLSMTSSCTRVVSPASVRHTLRAQRNSPNLLRSHRQPRTRRCSLRAEDGHASAGIAIPSNCSGREDFLILAARERHRQGTGIELS